MKTNFKNVVLLQNAGDKLKPGKLSWTSCSFFYSQARNTMFTYFFIKINKLSIAIGIVRPCFEQIIT